MCFEPGRLIRDQRIGSRVRFIKTIAGELFHEIENCTGQILVYLPRDCTLHKQIALLRHHSRVFLTHGLTQNIGPTQGVVCEHLRNLHHLLLIENNAVGVGQHRLELRVRISDFGTAVLPLNEIIDHA